MLVIKGGKIFTSAGKTYTQGDIHMEQDKIIAIGENLPIPPGAQVIDAAGLTVIPGIVDAHSHVGGFGRTMDDQDLNEMTHNVTPQVESFYSIDPQSPDFPRILKAGITTSAVAPGSGNVCGGLVCAVKSVGSTMGELCIANPIALKMALGGNPKNFHGKQRGQAPMTRMGIAQIIRDLYSKGQEYMKQQQEATHNPDKMPPYDSGLENVCRVLRREIPMKIHCEQFDMLTALRIADEFHIELTLDHAWGSSNFYDEISGNKNLRGVIFGPTNAYMLPGEIGKIDIECLAELDRRGVCCAIMTDGPILSPDAIVIQAGDAVRFGLAHEKAIEMLTINPAKIIGQQHRIGSIEIGKDADIVIFKGTPALDTAATVQYTIINGAVVYQA